MRNTQSACQGVRFQLITPALLFAFVSLVLASRAAGDVVPLAPSAIENGSLYYNYYGNGFSDSGYNLLTSTDLKASNSYSTLATHSYSSYRIFALAFDLTQFNNSSAIKSATLTVDEAITNYTAKLRLFSTTESIGLGTFSKTPFNDRTLAKQQATPTTIDLTALVQGAVANGADHLTIAARNSGGASGGLFGTTWISSVATWSNPQLSIVVPEPSSWAMLVSGAGLVLFLVRRRRRPVRLNS